MRLPLIPLTYRPLLILLLTLAPGALAQTSPINDGPLITEAQIAQWLADDPAILRAAAQKRGLEAEAAQIAHSGYEWTASYSRQEREYEQPEMAGMDKSREWNFELERSLRLPGKGAASRQQADAWRKLADANEQANIRNTIGELIDAYLDALHLTASFALLQQELDFAQTNLRAVEHRIKAGDAPALDARLAAAETQALAREHQQMRQQARASWTLFQSRYPSAPLSDFLPLVQDLSTGTATPDSKILKAIPTPTPLTGDLAHWQERLLANQPDLKQADASLKAASAAADKARHDRIPDPSIALFNGRESFGQENIIGLRLSMPIPGSHRSQTLRQRHAEHAAAQADREILYRSVRAASENLVRRADSEFRRWQLARQMADNLAENVRLLQKAYRLGEQDLQGLLLGQQQHTRAALAEVESRVEALRSQFQLRLAAGELNPF
jgi:cobalt-zinc-cadmium efflux system outer membrane protein